MFLELSTIFLCSVIIFNTISKTKTDIFLEWGFLFYYRQLLVLQS